MTRAEQPRGVAEAVEKRLEKVVREPDRGRGKTLFKSIRAEARREPHTLRAWIDGARALREKWEALNDAWGARWDALQIQRLRDVGCADMADLLESDADEFFRRSDKGEVELWRGGMEAEPEVEA